jgi:hypothetical protein
MSYILLRTDLNGDNVTIVATTTTYESRLLTFMNYCTTNNIAIKPWTYRDTKDGVGLYASSQLNDETNYILYQVYQLPDWEGDPTQNFWINDLGMFRWIVLPSTEHWEEVKSSDM